MRVLILNQAFYPDVVATAHYSTHLAVELAAEGHEVTAIAASRAYDNPAQRFPCRELWQNVRIERILSSGLGKAAKWHRLVDFGTFLLGCAWRLLRTRRQDVVVALTSPPLIGFLAALFVRLKGGQLVYWVMDLNPDQAIVAGILHEQSLGAKILEVLLRFTLSTSSHIVVLDRFMQARICQRAVDSARISTIPPWPHQQTLQLDESRCAAFRAKHGLQGKFVVMYAGNHSPCHPLDTLVRAAEQLAGDEEVVFCFVGGGSEHPKIAALAAQKQYRNIVCLPYPPVEELAEPLFAADLHVVVMGDPYVGIVHPCKVYNILALGTPLLYIGPAESHVTDLAATGAMKSSFYSAPHNGVASVVTAIQAAKQASPRKPAVVAARDQAVTQRFALLQLTTAIQNLHEQVPTAEPLGVTNSPIV